MALLALRGIIKNAHVINAFGHFQYPKVKKYVEDDTRWTVQLAIVNNKNIYFHNMGTQTWYEYGSNPCHRWQNDKWIQQIGFKPLNGYPTLHKSSAIVGFKSVNLCTIQEIEHLFERTVSLQKEIDKFDALNLNLPVC